MKPLAPDLFQRRYQDLVEIGHARVPALAPEWTDHNAHDPGIMLMELLAWVSEAQLYSLSRQRRDERAAYAGLVGVNPSGTYPSGGLIWSDPTDPNSPMLTFQGSMVVAADTPIHLVNADTPTFRPTNKLLWIPGTISKLESRLADGSVVDLTATNQRGSISFRPFRESAGPKDTLRLTFAARGDSGIFGANRNEARGALWAIGIRSAETQATSADSPNAPVGGSGSALTAALIIGERSVPLSIARDSSCSFLKTGALLLSLDNVPGSPKECIIEFRAPHGLPRSPQLLHIEASVIPIQQGQTISDESHQVPDDPTTPLGLPDRSFTLGMPGLRFRPGQEPVQVKVQEKDGFHLWEQRDDLSACGPDDRVYQLDPSGGIITFGNGINGKIPDRSAQVLASYAVCDGARGNIARNRKWSVLGFPGAFGANVDAVAGGRDSTSLLDLRRQARLEAVKEHCLVTPDDIVSAAKSLPLMDVARAWIANPPATAPRTGVVTLVAMLKRSSAEEPANIPETPRWLQAIRNRLRTLIPLGTRLEVVAPDYSPFSIQAGIESKAGIDPQVVKTSVQKVLLARLTLVDRGDGNQPRQPGAPVTSRDVSAWIRLVDGVARVTSVQLLSEADKPVSEVHVSANGLPKYNSVASLINVTRSQRGGPA